MASSLTSAVSSLQSSIQLLDSSINTLDSGVNDFPRLRKVLQTHRHYELLPEPTLHEAQQSLHDEIGPSITHLLSIVTNYVDKLARREQALKAKCELQEGRLSSDESQNVNRSGSAAGSRTGSGLGSDSNNAARAAEFRRLVQKKERLKYAVERLELQSTQRQRQLRKSMAFQ